MTRIHLLGAVDRGAASVETRGEAGDFRELGGKSVIPTMPLVD